MLEAINNIKKNIKKKRIIIEGITQNGEKFRPGDWSERMCGCLAKFDNRRISYSPQLHPIVNNENNSKCLVLDPLLEETNPYVFERIMLFARENYLKIREDYEYDE